MGDDDKFLSATNPAHALAREHLQQLQSAMANH